MPDQSQHQKVLIFIGILALIALCINLYFAGGQSDVRRVSTAQSGSPVSQSSPQVYYPVYHKGLTNVRGDDRLILEMTNSTNMYVQAPYKNDQGYDTSRSLEDTSSGKQQIVITNGTITLSDQWSEPITREPWQGFDYDIYGNISPGPDGSIGQVRDADICRHERSEQTPNLQTSLAYEILFRTPVRNLFSGVHQDVEQKLMYRIRLLILNLAKSGRSRVKARKIEILNNFLRERASLDQA
jgi:hypothetical protein